MNQDRLFKTTRWRLASWYAGVMSIILSGCGLGAYHAIAHAHQVTIDREIESVAGAFHDSLELYLQEPGKLESSVNNLFPSLCLVAVDCSQVNSRDRHQINAVDQGGYYLRLLDTSRRLVAVVGRQPEGLPTKLKQQSKEQSWIHLQDNQGNRYHQIALSLETNDNRQWGHLLVGRSLQDFQRYVANVGWILFLGFPLALILVVISAWYLAGLAMQPIYHSYRQIEQFTADAAHELRTPLATIRATIESVLLLPIWQESEVKESLGAIERQNNRMSGLVADLLTLSRLERESDRPSVWLGDRIVLNDLINDIAEEFAALALAAEIKLVTDVRVCDSLQIVGNEVELYRLLANLVVNGIQYTPPQGIVTIILETDDLQAIVRVQDTGIGIPLAEQSQIFERFYRVNSDRSRNSGGSGLGLALAQAIAIAHQGIIQVKSEPNKGSTFILRLTLK